MKLKLSEVNKIYETLISFQEYELTALMGHKLRMVKGEIEKAYLSGQKALEELYKKYDGKQRGLTMDFSHIGEEKIAEFNASLSKLLDDASEYKIEPIPLSLLLEQGKLPLKFSMNLDQIIAKE